MKKALRTALVLIGACLFFTAFTINHTAFAQEVEGERLVDDPAIQEALSYILFHDMLFEDDNQTMPAWLTYGFARLGWIKDHYKVPFKEMTPDMYYIYYEEELYGRDNLVAVWEELKEQDPAMVDTYLDEMSVIRQAGYMPEYVWVYTYFDAYDKEPSEDRLKEFEDWYYENLPTHIPQNLVGLAWEHYDAEQGG
ncbi:hypothetical protein ACFL4E_02205 [Candidatus Omnitrophota bacterium]